MDFSDLLSAPKWIPFHHNQAAISGSLCIKRSQGFYFISIFFSLHNSMGQLWFIFDNKKHDPARRRGYFYHAAGSCHQFVTFISALER